MRQQSPQLPRSVPRPSPRLSPRAPATTGVEKNKQSSQQQLRCLPRLSPRLLPSTPESKGTVNSKDILNNSELIFTLRLRRLTAHLDREFRSLFTHPGLLRLGTLLLVSASRGFGVIADQANNLVPGRAQPSFQVNDRRLFCRELHYLGVRLQTPIIQAAAQALSGSCSQPLFARFLLSSAKSRCKAACWCGTIIPCAGRHVKVNFFANRGFEFGRSACLGGKLETTARLSSTRDKNMSGGVVKNS